MELVIITGIDPHELQDILAQIVQKAEMESVSIVSSKNPIQVEIFDTITKDRIVGTEALFRLLELYKAKLINN